MASTLDRRPAILVVPTNSTSIFDLSPYHYIPTESVCIIFVALFSVSLFIHTAQMMRYRLWWLAPSVLLGLFGEVVGWAGRLWSSQNYQAGDPFTMQIVCTIIAPTPFVAAIFITFGHFVRRVGEQYSWLSARLYSRFFLTFDIVSLVIQAAGGGIASSATTTSGTNLGGHIMLAGIIAQMIALSMFTVLFIQFFICFFLDRPVRPVTSTYSSTVTLTNKYVWNLKLQLLSFSMAFITLVLMIRAVYRTIELSDGWNGSVISTQKWFNIFDGMMVTLAVYTFNILHPGYLLFSQLQADSVEGTPEAKNTVETFA